jgi:2-oxoglutarate ferredoxin oxidoreductase subunit alpha
MAIPGMPGGQYTADGLTHNERGTPTSNENDHHVQLDKRRRKLEEFSYGDHWATIEGDGELAVLTWGSLTGAVREAVDALRGSRLAVRLIAPRLLLPAQPERLQAALKGVDRVLIVEQTHGGQFYRYLRAHYDLPAQVRLLHRPGPLPIRASQIVHSAMQWSA